MSDNWNFQLLIKPGELTEIGLSRALRRVQGHGVTPERRNGIECFSADGFEVRRFPTMSEATEWLAVEGGLLSLGSGRYDIEFGMSVHLAAKILPLEMATLPDTPLFDVVQISIGQSYFRSPQRENAWNITNRILRDLLVTVPVEFGYGLDEFAIERYAHQLVVHSRVAAGQLPAVLGWINMTGVHSALERPLTAAAALLGREVVSVDRGAALMQVSSRPWGAADEALAAANERWMTVQDDPGFGPQG